ncbi:MAG: NAD(P)H-dependent oxidoreductase subunit E, partial [Thermodesulfovibrionales bacterium]|nr:NAD(P)H-dependent oxidoreductase subunit E [Thermodesulfovibrionales bacterium]
MERLKSIDDLKKLSDRLKDETFRPEIPRVRLCNGTACTATGTPKVLSAMEEEAGKRGINLDIVKTGCQGLCQKGPVMKVEPLNIFYQKVKPEHARSILAYTVQGGMPFRQSLYRQDILSEPIPEMTNVPFYKKQFRIALRNNGLIDPRNIYHYIAVGGYSALEKALGSMKPDEVLNE